MLTALVVWIAVALALQALYRWLVHRPFSLNDKVIVITGAGMGIGRRLAEEIFIHTSNATLVLLDINHDAVLKTKRYLEGLAATGKKPSTVRVYQCDVSDPELVEGCIQRILEDVAPQPIAVLINNAGVVIGKSIMDLSPSEVRRTFDVNVVAHFWMVKSVLPSMKQCEEAMIVSISSILGYCAGARLADYVASKSAVVGFHDSLCPLGTNTGMFRWIFEHHHGFLNVQEVFAPLLQESDVATSIHRAMVRGEEQVISCHPGWLRVLHEWITPIYRLLPPTLRDYTYWASGAVYGMDTFVGRIETAAAVGRTSEKAKQA
ncbi:hypothetical protein Poli38472_010611 [Pythium oligandrum]|uniref:Ketoreductase domain-containing protein n=1 Tax=Pythium oligandrum TaxID=41045 RepID=A0A8K1C3G5_PYTOL|nr:hypothetical protein Poli38472_010611 [Pythium oligandrum]|eukprot:TMW55729.1 hypothetical protein Poli38472_010611 [Pythium oligandrum]